MGVLRNEHRKKKTETKEDVNKGKDQCNRRIIVYAKKKYKNN